MKITAVRATPVTVPLKAPLRHANGCHWGTEQAIGFGQAMEDPLRPGWAPLLPNDRFADPKDGRVPKVPD
jgi:hypothetical protein